MNKNPLVSICLPTYNSADFIKRTLDNITKQKYQNFEIIIFDDASTDDTVKVIKKYKDPRIRLFVNPKNMGYGKNLQNFKKEVRGEIMFLMGQDDLIINDGLTQTVNAFLTHPGVAAVTRAYYWFDSTPEIPIRHIPPADPKKDLLVDIRHNPHLLIPVIESVGQLSGLAYAVKYFTQFEEECFPAHIYPFLKILKKHACISLKDYTIAVSTFTSQTRFKPSIYKPSPTLTWMEMFDKVFHEKEFSLHRRLGKNHMAKNYLGLVQIKNYAPFPYLLKEIYYLIKYRPLNLLSPGFWFYTLGCLLTPRPLSIKLVDWYKTNLNSKLIKLNTAS